MSLLPSTTEILFAIGAGDDVVGVTFECDHPREARERRIVSTSALPEGLDSAEIDAFVTAAMHAGEDLYHLDEGALSGLGADLVVTQDLCAVCAVDVSVVDDALAHLGCTAEVLTIDPHDLAEVLDSIGVLGAATGHQAEADRLVASLRARLDTVREEVAARAAGAAPRVLLLEWTDPPFAPGHWVPEMVTIAGGVPTIGEPGEKSVRVTWEQALAVEPDVVVCAPCGLRPARIGGAGARACHLRSAAGAHPGVGRGCERIVRAARPPAGGRCGDAGADVRPDARSSRPDPSRVPRSGFAEVRGAVGRSLGCHPTTRDPWRMDLEGPAHAGIPCAPGTRSFNQTDRVPQVEYAGRHACKPP